jgi:hypothetical protein
MGLAEPCGLACPRELVGTHAYDNDDDNFDYQGNEYDEEATFVASILDNFREYVQKMETMPYYLPTTVKKAIRLMIKLRKSSAALETYEDIMEWHLHESNLVERHKKITGTQYFISRKKLFEMLWKRYNFWGNVNISRHIVLPSSGAKVKITNNSAMWCLQSLLTDPRLTDQDYLFHDNDP